MGRGLDVLTTRIEVNKEFRETISHGTPQFPIQVYDDEFERIAGGMVSWHWHPELEFSVVTRGKVIYSMNDITLTATAGEGLFVNSNVLHSVCPAEGYEDSVLFSVVFSPDFIAGNHDGVVYRKYVDKLIQNAALTGILLDNREEWKAEILDNLYKIHQLDMSRGLAFELSCHNLICQSWYYIVCHVLGNSEYAGSGHNPRMKERVKLMLEYIHHHFSENIAVEEIAAAAAVSVSECFRCFRKTLHKKPVEYLNEYRLEQAVKMLRDTDYPIADITVACGFNHSSYFGKLFKQKMGMAPSEYRKRNRRNSLKVEVKYG